MRYKYSSLVRQQDRYIVQQDRYSKARQIDRKARQIDSKARQIEGYLERSDMRLSCKPCPSQLKSFYKYSSPIRWRSLKNIVILMERNINRTKFLKYIVQKHKNLYFSHTQLITTQVLYNKREILQQSNNCHVETNEEILIKRIVYLL